MTIAPKKRSNSYRDPTLSDKWLDEAEWRAKNPLGSPRLTSTDARKIILRLVEEVRNINKETGR